MGLHQNPIFASLDSKGDLDQESCTDGKSWKNDRHEKTKRARTTTTKRSGIMVRKNKKRTADCKRINLKKRRRSIRFGGIEENNNGVQRRVRILKRLIPNSDSNSEVGLDGLFRETAEYVLSLQSRVKLMHIMVKALAGSNDDD